MAPKKASQTAKKKGLTLDLSTNKLSKSGDDGSSTDSDEILAGPSKGRAAESSDSDVVDRSKRRIPRPKTPATPKMVGSRVNASKKASRRTPSVAKGPANSSGNVPPVNKSSTSKKLPKLPHKNMPGLERGDAPPKVHLRQLKAQAKNALQLIEEDSDESSDEIPGVLKGEDAMKHVHLANIGQGLDQLATFNIIATKLNVLKKVEITPTVDYARKDMDYWLNQPRLSGKRWRLVDVLSATQQGKAIWKIRMTDYELPGSDKTGGNRSTSVHQSLCPNQRDAETIGRRVCLIAERSPMAVPKNFSMIMQNILKTAIDHGGFVSTPQNVCPAITRKVKGSMGYASTYNFIDLATGTTGNQVFHVKLDHVDRLSTVPPLPAHVSAPDFEEFEGFEDLPADVQTKERKAFELARYVAYSTNGHFATREELRSYHWTLRTPYQTQKQIKRGPYDGKPLYKVITDKYSRTIRIRPSKAVRDSLEKKKKVVGVPDYLLPDIILYSLNRKRVAKVTEIMYQAWLRTGDILDTWRDGCRAAQIINESRELSTEYGTCRCTEEQASKQTHICDSCGKPEICAELKVQVEWFGRARVCRVCQIDPDSAVRTRTAYKDIPLDQRIVGRVSLAVRKEARKRDYDEYETEQELDQLVKKLTDSFDEKTKTFMSVYTDEQLNDSTNQIKDTPSPYRPSVEAVFPVYPGTENDGKVQLTYHALGNIAICELFLNALKWTYPPVVLQVVSDWLRKCEEDLDLDAALTELRLRMDDVCDVRLQVPYTQDRLQQVSKAASEQLMLEFKTGHTEADTSKARTKGLLDQTTRGGRDDYEPADAARKRKVIAEIEEQSNEVLPRGQIDDCPYPFDGEAPPSWCWWVCEGFSQRRLDCMWLLCNGEHETIDTPETLFLEAIYQWCNPDINDGEILNLRRSVRLCQRHPLKMSYGHLIHKKPMETGWAGKLKPTSAQDYDKDRCNISVEAWITNTMKSDFDPRYYKRMVRTVASIQLKPELYSPVTSADLKKMQKSKRADDLEDLAEIAADEPFDEVDIDIIDDELSGWGDEDYVDEDNSDDEDADDEED